MDGKNASEPILELMTSPEVQKLLKISEGQLRKETYPRGPLKAVLIGKRCVRYRPADVQAYLEQRLGLHPTTAA
ncbi:helix-turn-helix domain-containing protein [bacterium]|nr:helix-turn-helix domain-containing protein [bacterium]